MRAVEGLRWLKRAGLLITNQKPGSNCTAEVSWRDNVEGRRRVLRDGGFLLDSEKK